MWKCLLSLAKGLVSIIIGGVLGFAIGYLFLVIYSVAVGGYFEAIVIDQLLLCFPDFSKPFDECLAIAAFISNYLVFSIIIGAVATTKIALVVSHKKD